MSQSFDDEARRVGEANAAEIFKKIGERALNATKKMNADFKCKKCGAAQRQLAEFEDTRAMLDAAEFLANRGFGRPAAKADEKDSEKVVFVRKVILGSDEPDD